jgi:restriction system protein
LFVSPKVALGTVMPIIQDSPEFNFHLIGRRNELNWLFERAQSRGKLVSISGSRGVGKTTLLNQFLAGIRTPVPPLLWTLRSPPNEALAELTARIDALYRERNIPEYIAIDDADVLPPAALNSIAGRILNLKTIRMLILASRQRPDISRADFLELGPMSGTDLEEMVKRLLGQNFRPEELAAAVSASAGLPSAVVLLGELARGRTQQEIAQLLKGEIYDLNKGPLLPKKELINDVKPRIILANDDLIDRLRRQPQSVFQLPPRKFEELIAELLSDMGYEVELTPATRDGGKDILAYMPAPHGNVLCLVEAKRYRKDRPVGVELVRQLYGTLVDADASSAMLVTTSSFSSDARAFQKRHQYKLALRDYGNVVQWVQDYRGGGQVSK